MMDIEQYTKTEKEIKRERKFLQDVIATIPNSLLVIDRDLRIKSANHSFYKLFQTRPKKVIGSKIADVLGDEDGKLSAELTRLLGTEDMLENFELYYQSEKLGERIFNILARGIIVAEEEEEEEEEEEQLLVVMQDITERQRAKDKLQESEEFSSSLVNNSPNPILVINPDTSVRHVNPALEELIGFTSAELVGRKAPYPWWTEETLHKTRRDFEEAMRQGIRRVEELFQKKSGERFWAKMTSTPVISNGEFKYYLSSWIDITQRKKAEEEIKYQREYFQALFKDSPEAVASLDAQHLIVDINPAFEKIFGYTLEDIKGKDLDDCVVPESRKEEGKNFSKRVWKGEVVVAESVRKRADGGEIPVSILIAPIVIGDKQVGTFAIYRDITERKKAKEEIEIERARFKSIFDYSVEGIVILDKNYNILDVNQGFEKIFRYNPGEVEGKQLNDIIVPEQFHTEGEDLDKMALHGLLDYEAIRKRKDGTEINVSISGGPIKVSGQVVGIFGIYRDITERKKVEEETKYQTKYFQALFKSSPEAVASLDAQNRIVDINPVFEKTFGYTLEDIKGKDIDDCIVPRSKKEEGGSLTRKATHGELVVAESVRKRADGREIPVSILGAPVILNGKQIGIFAIYRDVTERKKAQKQLERSFVDLAETISRAMSLRDPYTAGHQRRVAKLAYLVGEKLRLDEDRLTGLYIGGLLHDIGKISAPESILSKPGKLTDEEWNLIHAHAKQGYEILKDTKLPWPVADMALHHHERLDGSGYPHGISGDKLSLEVRILGVCDVVEAMSSHRPYRPAKSKEEVLEEIQGGRGTKYDPAVVDIMLQIIESGELELLPQAY